MQVDTVEASTLDVVTFRGLQRTGKPAVIRGKEKRCSFLTVQFVRETAMPMIAFPVQDSLMVGQLWSCGVAMQDSSVLTILLGM